MKKTIAVLGLLLAGCDNSQAQVRSVEFFLKNLDQRLLVSQDCARKQNDNPECQNAKQAFVLEDIQSYKPEQLTVEGQIKDYMGSASMANQYCISTYNLEKTNLNYYLTIPLDNPICQNHIKAVRQVYERCVKQNSNFSLGTDCGIIKVYADEINAKIKQ